MKNLSKIIDIVADLLAIARRFVDSEPVKPQKKRKRRKRRRNS